MTIASALDVADGLERARRDLLAAIDDLPAAELRRRPSADSWAIIELLAHLPDVDRYYASQARKLRDVPGHTFVYFDEEAWTRQNADAIDRDVRNVKLAMAAAHGDVMRWALSLTTEELERAGGHPRRGTVTVREMLERIATHDRVHTEQVRAIHRALEELG